MKKNHLYIYCISILFAGCLSQKNVTAWKVEDRVLPVYNKIMVVGIIKDINDSLRRKIEDSLVKNLTALGYNAVSALKEFGPGGLSDLGHEATYIKLCNDEIDVVLTIALLDKLKQNKNKRNKYPAGPYFYNRIWNYKTMQADLSDEKSPSERRYIWESILFDLNTLQPLCVVQSKSFNPRRENANGYAYAYQITEKMKKEQVLAEMNVKLLRPF